jgi:hypothetical protein
MVSRNIQALITSLYIIMTRETQAGLASVRYGDIHLTSKFNSAFVHFPFQAIFKIAKEMALV